MLGLPSDSSKIELEILINHEKQKRLESELQQVIVQRKQLKAKE
jgi:hypothetical protein